MTKSMKSLLTLSVLVVFLLSSPNNIYAQSQSETDPILELVKKAPSKKDYPQANALILLEECKKIVNPDGSSETWEHLVVKIFDETGKKDFSDIRNEYDSKSEEIQIIEARTIKEDGTILEVPENAKNDVIPWYLMDALIYANVKDKVISFLGLEKGSTIDLEIKKISRKSTIYGNFWGQSFFQTFHPILESRYTLVVPKNFDLKYSIKNGNVEPVVTENDGNKTHIWEVKDVPRIVWEPNMSYRHVTPYLQFSSLKSWKKIGDWFAQLFYPKLKADQNLKNKVFELTKNAKDKQEKIKEIYLYATTQIRGIKWLQLGKGGWEPHPAFEVYKNKYGDYRDKAVLLITMLKEAGVDAYPALISTSKAPINHNIPYPKQFNTLIVAVPKEKKASKTQDFIWLDPFSDNLRYGELLYEYENREAFVVTPDKSFFVKTPASTIEENLSQEIATLKLRADGSVKGKIEYLLCGYFDYLARKNLMELTPQKKEMRFSDAANKICEGAKLLDFHLSDLKDLNNKVEFFLDFSAKEYGIKEKGLLIFEIPSSPFRFTNININTNLEKRNFDLLLDSPMQKTSNVEIYLPKGYKVYSLPQDLDFQNGIGKISLKCKKIGKRINYSLTLSVTKTHISAFQYSLLKELLGKLSLPEYNLIMLERI